MYYFSFLDVRGRLDFFLLTFAKEELLVMFDGDKAGGLKSLRKLGTDGGSEAHRKEACKSKEEEDKTHYWEGLVETVTGETLLSSLLSCLAQGIHLRCQPITFQDIITRINHGIYRSLDKGNEVSKPP